MKSLKQKRLFSMIAWGICMFTSIITKNLNIPFLAIFFMILTIAFLFSASYFNYQIRKVEKPLMENKIDK